MVMLSAKLMMEVMDESYGVFEKKEPDYKYAEKLIAQLNNDLDELSKVIS